MKLKAAVIAIFATMALGIAASSAIGDGYQVIFGYAKRAMSREAADVCARTTGCKSWSVKPCARRSWHRVDCRANFFFAEGGQCSMVMLAIYPPWANEVIVRHKRIFCN
jgi:hypothetical protein